MPKPTFFNLAEGKRERILSAALDEFAEKGYAGASISGIVAAAGIAKGSFYQYFEDKDDLYIHLYDIFVVTEKTRVFEQEAHTLEQLSLTGFLRLAFTRQLEFFSRDTRLAKLGADLVRNAHLPIFKTLQAKYKGLTDDYFLPYINIEVQRGELDAAINARLLNFMLISAGNYLLYLIQHEGVNILDAGAINALADDLEYILTHGIYKRATNPHEGTAE